MFLILDVHAAGLVSEIVVLDNNKVKINLH